MASYDDRPAPAISFSMIRERYGDDLYEEAAQLLRAHVPYFDPAHDTYYYVYHYLMLICSVLAGGKTPRIGNMGGTVCEACGGLGVAWRDQSDAVCQHCRGEGNIIRLVISEEPVVVEE